MADYRVYFGGSDGHFKDAADIEAVDDQAAIERATDLAKGRKVQVWCLTRHVMTVNENQAPNAAPFMQGQELRSGHAAQMKNFRPPV